MKKKTKKVLFAILYWAISLTWGLPLSLIGLMVAGFCIVFLKGKPHKNGCTFIVEIGGNWGGLELGCTAICGNYSTTDVAWYEHTRRHEFGHSLQHLILSVFFLPIIGIPSAIRYWYQRIRTSKGLPNKPYDSAWYEGGASRWGTKVINWYESKQ